jgi:hypothetical protein
MSNVEAGNGESGVGSRELTGLGAVINYDYTLLAGRFPAPSLVCGDGRDTADIARFRS